MNFYLIALALVLRHGTTTAADELTDSLTITSTDPNDINFFLYSNPSNTNDYDELIYQNTASVSNSRYNSSYPAILLIHGFIQNYTSQFPVYVRDAYLEAGFASKANIIVVNWGNLSSASDHVDIPLVGDILEFPVYLQAVSNVYVVGKRVQEFLVFLQDNGFLSGGENVHLVGQSLGAHVSGMAGFYYQQATGSSIKRITGTDPASPGFQGVDNVDERLDSSDADFVDIVHTNQGEFGYLGNLGHVDFYVNGGGPGQPACGLANATDFVCAHNLAPRFYAKSILTDTYKACPRRVLGIFTSLLCTPSNKIVFGEYVPESARGRYALDMQL